MRRNWMLTLTVLGSVVLAWALVCDANEAAAEPSKPADCDADAKCSVDKGKCGGEKGKSCPASAKGKCGDEKGKCGHAHAKGKCGDEGHADAKGKCGDEKGKSCPADAKGKCCDEKGKSCPADGEAKCSSAKGKGCSAVKGKNRTGPAVKQASHDGSADVAKAAQRLEQIGYSKKDIAALPASAILASAGNGYPVGFANLQTGQAVVDLGCGSGIDCLLAATLVGSQGHVIGVDKSPERIAAAQENKRKTHLANVDFREGLLEKLPLEDESVDVAISNCVPPVMRGKDVVLREAFRVLKPGGRLVTTSWLVDDDTPDEALSPKEGWEARMGLKLLRQKDYVARLHSAGFAKVEFAAKSPTSTPHKAKLMVVARKGK